MKEESYKYPEGTIMPMVPGPWNDEPDKLQYTDKETGLPCLVVRNGAGALCGYVGVDEKHPYFNKPYQDIGNLSVHGGLTFSDFCQEDGGHICHKVEPGENDRVWWLGFDCNHSGDFAPGLNYKFGEADDYKDLDYVKGECAILALQLKAIGEPCEKQK